MTAPIPRDIPDLPVIPGMPAPLQSVVPASAVVAPNRRPVAAAFRLLVALTAATGVGVELVRGSPPHVLSYFMIQTGVLVAVVFTSSASRAWTARRPLPPLVTGGTLLYVSIAALICHMILTGGSPPFLTMGPTPTPTLGAGAGPGTGEIATLAGWPAQANPLLHTLLPVAVAADWLLLTRPAPLRPALAATWLLYPLAYLAFTLARGVLLPDGSSASYLYPFLDVDQQGYKSVLANALLIGLACYALGLLLVALDHLRPNPVRARRGRLDW
ncbi:Pr6Pr family membrane protein [Streptomyces bluensis]|uniref:Pr6Pr family membrane protein n=1 Tax=Streptomyces bluensis TaxID=33897 RepID=UPI0016768873|nr:Pr6Pr family membrane protein [Streptomyces bluensis]GGZ81213.1 integral membrane regulator [Streptomyces bluensis]